MDACPLPRDMALVPLPVERVSMRPLFISAVLLALTGCAALGGRFGSPPQNGHDLATRIAALVHSGHTETRKEAYNYFGIDPASPRGRIIDPAAYDERAPGSVEWAMSYTGKDSSKGMNVLVWKEGAWCIRVGELETLLRFRFDRPEGATTPGFAVKMRHDGSVEKVSATFAPSGCMTAFWMAVQ